jgi:uroporphyrinogen decarboxylase
MTHKERAAIALNGGIPDYVPTFELEYQLAEEVFGKRFLYSSDLKNLSLKEREKAVKENAEYMLHVYGELGYSIIPVHYLPEPELKETVRHIRALTGEQYMLTTHGDNTFSIGDGEEMMKLSCRLFEDPDGARAEAAARAASAIERNKRLVDAGFDSFILCSDYYFKSIPAIHGGVRDASKQNLAEKADASKLKT